MFDYLLLRCIKNQSSGIASAYVALFSNSARQQL